MWDLDYLVQTGVLGRNMGETLNRLLTTLDRTDATSCAATVEELVAPTSQGMTGSATVVLDVLRSHLYSMD